MACGLPLSQAPLQSPVVVSCDGSPFGRRRRQALHNSAPWLCSALQLGTERWSRPPGEAALLQAGHPCQPLGSQHSCFPQGQAQGRAAWLVGFPGLGTRGIRLCTEGDAASCSREPFALGQSSHGQSVLEGCQRSAARVLPPRGAFVGDRREQEAAMRLIELSPASLKVACSQRLCSRSPPATVSYFKQSV